MADNIQVTPGTGDTVACDQVVDSVLGTVKVQYVKIMDGSIDGTTKGVVGANGLKADVYVPGPIGVQIVGGGGSGDSYVNQGGAWATAITGDVLLRSNPNTIIGQLAGTLGVNVIGGSIGARISASGDLNVIPSASSTAQFPVSQGGGWRVSISGDSTTPIFVQPGAGTNWNTKEQNVVGVQVIGGSIGAQISASGDLAVKPQAGLTKFPTSGDSRIIDGTDPTIRATVKSFVRGNPLGVVLMNASGDVVNPQPDQPIILTVAGRATNQGSTQIVAAVAGRRIKVFSYSLQGDGDNSRGFFASGASGTQLSLEWELASREGVAKQVGSESAQFLFATTAGAALSFESSSSRPMKYEVAYQTDDAT